MVPKVCVTVPVYNTARYLCKCLESLRNQTLQDVEFILVDDGSTDESGIICDEYAEKDSRFRVIHQANGGLAVARQIGLDAAKGEYVIVCDSDDWVEPDMYKKLYDAAKVNDADIAVCGYFAEYVNGRSVPKQVHFNQSGNYVDNRDFLERGADSSWLKLIKRSLFGKSRVNYEPGINLSEDSLIIYKLMKGNPKIVQISEHLYHYRRLYGGVSYTNNLKMATILQLEYTYRWLAYNYDCKVDGILYDRAINLAFACMRASDIDHRYLNKFLRDELPWKRLTLRRQPLKTMMVALEKLLPIKWSQRLFGVFYPILYK